MRNHQKDINNRARGAEYRGWVVHTTSNPVFYCATVSMVSRGVLDRGCPSSKLPPPGAAVQRARSGPSLVPVVVRGRWSASPAKATRANAPDSQVSLRQPPGRYCQSPYAACCTAAPRRGAGAPPTAGMPASSTTTSATTSPCCTAPSASGPQSAGRESPASLDRGLATGGVAPVGRLDDVDWSIVVQHDSRCAGRRAHHVTRTGLYRDCYHTVRFHRAVVCIS